MSIKEYILNNFKDASTNDIEDAINDSINSKDEVVLPGLGVLFEVIWENGNNNLRNELLNILATIFDGNISNLFLYFNTVSL